MTDDAILSQVTDQPTTETDNSDIPKSMFIKGDVDRLTLLLPATEGGYNTLELINV